MKMKLRCFSKKNKENKEKEKTGMKQGLISEPEKSKKRGRGEED
jgi:hypothetical protein